MEMEGKESVTAQNAGEAEIGTTETMKDYERELEASFRKIEEGDIIDIDIPAYSVNLRVSDKELNRTQEGLYAHS